MSSAFIAGHVPLRKVVLHGAGLAREAALSELRLQKCDCLSGGELQGPAWEV